MSTCPRPSWLKEEVARDHLLLSPDVKTLTESEGSSLTAYLRERLALDTGEPSLPVVMDLSRVSLITSPAIGALIFLHKRLASDEVPFILLDLEPMVAETLIFLKLDQVLTICQSPDEMRRALDA